MLKQYEKSYETKINEYEKLIRDLDQKEKDCEIYMTSINDKFNDLIERLHLVKKKFNEDISEFLIKFGQIKNIFKKSIFELEQSSIQLLKCERTQIGIVSKIIQREIKQSLSEIKNPDILKICDKIKKDIKEIEKIERYSNLNKYEFKGKLKCTLTGHSSAIYSLILLPDGNLASGSGDGTIKVWDTNDFQCLSTLTGHSNFIWSLILLQNGNLASGSADGKIKVWDTNDFKCLSTLTGHSGSIFSLILLPNGNLASGSDDITIKVWD